MAVAHLRLGLNAVLAYFLGCYILTRPLGASLGDYVWQSIDDGGLGLGLSAIFLAAIVGLVTYLIVRHVDDPVPQVGLGQLFSAKRKTLSAIAAPSATKANRHSATFRRVSIQLPSSGEMVIQKLAAADER